MTAYSDAQDADTPFARWQLEEASGTAVDDDKGTRDGTISGGVTLSQACSWPAAGNGMAFDGASGVVTLTNMSTALGIGTLEAVVAWNGYPTSGSTAPSVFAHVYTSGSIIPMVLFTDSAQGGRITGGYWTGSTWVQVYWTPPVIGALYHCIVKYDGTTLTLRVNNVQVHSITVGTVRPTSGTVQAAGYIGRRWDNADFFQGTIYGVALYAAALSDARCIVHWNQLVNPLADAFPGGTIYQAATPLTVTSLDVTGFSTEGSEPGSMDRTGWASFTPTQSGVYRINTVGSSFDTKLAVYTGSAIGSLSLVGSDDNSGASNTSILDVTMTAGTTYRIQVGAQSGGAGGTLSFGIVQVIYSGSVATDGTVTASTTVPNGHVYKGRLTKAEDLSGVS